MLIPPGKHPTWKRPKLQCVAFVQFKNFGVALAQVVFPLAHGFLHCGQKGSGCCLYLQQSPGALLPQLHPDGDVVDLRRRRAEVLVLQTRAQEVLAAGFEEKKLLGVMATGFVPGTERRRLSA